MLMEARRAKQDCGKEAGEAWKVGNRDRTQKGGQGWEGQSQAKWLPPSSMEDSEKKKSCYGFSLL